MTDFEKQKEKIRLMLSELETVDTSEALTSWENNFIQSISDQFSHKESLSSKQYDLLEKLYNQKVLGLEE